jgi:glycosyltransferase involved in cell wall biosynthesis
LKKVLYIAYYWPPCGGIGVVRNLKFVKYFRNHGWEPIVYAPENASYPIIDPSTEKDLPENVTILKTPIFEPYGLFNLAKGNKKSKEVKDVFLVNERKKSFMHELGLRIRGNFFIPDARAFWIKPSIKYLRKYLQENPVDAIISYGPPHSMHLIAKALHTEFNIPWVSDWQDPWTEIDYFSKFKMSEAARKKHIRLEKEVITEADALVMVSKSWCNDLEKLSGRPVHYIPFGYDESDFAPFTYKRGDHFTISHFGTFGIDRNPINLWKALQELKAEIPGFEHTLKIHLAGQVAPAVFESLNHSGLTPQLQYDKQIHKDELFGYLTNSNVQLVLINTPEEGIAYNNKGRVPAKVFECIGSKQPVLVIGPTDGDVANIVAETQTGITCSYDDSTLIKKTIKTWFDNWQNNTPSTQPKNIEQFSFNNLSKQMAEVLNKISTNEIRNSKQ